MCETHEPPEHDGLFRNRDGRPVLPGRGGQSGAGYLDRKAAPGTVRGYCACDGGPGAAPGRGGDGILPRYLWDQLYPGDSLPETDPHGPWQGYPGAEHLLFLVLQQPGGDEAGGFKPSSQGLLSWGRGKWCRFKGGSQRDQHQGGPPGGGGHVCAPVDRRDPGVPGMGGPKERLLLLHGPHERAVR